MEIQEILADPGGGSAVATGVVPIPVWPSKVAWGLAGIVLGAVVAALILQPSPEERSATRFTLTLPEDVQLSHAGRGALAFSPDGRRLAYTANEQIYVRDMERGEAQPLAGTDGGREPIFSPDGQWIAFWTGQGNALKKVAVSGGTPITLCNTAPPYGMSWDTEEAIYYGQEPAGIFRVAAIGGEPERIVEVAIGEEASFPQLLPERNQLLFTLGGRTNDEGVVIVESLTTGERRVVFQGGRNARYLPTGHLVFAAGNVLELIPFDADRLEVRGCPVPLVEDVFVFNVLGTAGYSISQSGSLAYLPGT